MSTAIITAAGQGTRFGGAQPKQFLELAGKPVLIHTLIRFEKCSAINEIVLVLAENVTTEFTENVASYNFSKPLRIVAGGNSRAASVYNGLQAVTASDNEIITVHDGARPLVAETEITATIESARQTGAACLVAPVTDTIKEIANGQITRTVNRSVLRRALTPQCFRFDVLRRAFENARKTGQEFTDESMMVEALGIPVAIVEGNSRNIKITVPEDLILAEALFNSR